jgi:hypothetical protein
MNKFWGSNVHYVLYLRAQYCTLEIAKGGSKVFSLYIYTHKVCEGKDMLINLIVIIISQV